MTNANTKPNMCPICCVDRDEIAELTASNSRLRDALEYAINPDNQPEYHQQGMGCGLEDRSIHDRYEAMEHGWDEAMERIYSEVMPDDSILSETPEASLKIIQADAIQEILDKNAEYLAALIDADNLARVIDEQITSRQLHERSQTADARLDYGTPFVYKYAANLRGEDD